MIGEDIIFPLTIPPGDIYTVFQLLLPTILTRTRDSGVRVRIVALRARHFFLSADARIGNASNRRKGLTQVLRETRIYQGISEPARNVTGFLADLLRMCQV